MIGRLRRLAERKKKLKENTLDDWTLRDLFIFILDFGMRLIRGVFLSLRLKNCDGWMLCGGYVKVSFHRGISVGKQFSLEDQVEIIGLSKRGIVFGNRCTVKSGAMIRPTNALLGEAGEGLHVGDHSNIGAGAYIGCSGFIEIGNNVMMGPKVNLMSENHAFTRTDIPMKQQGVSRSFIKIEDDVWLGVGCSILAGVTVGEGSIVAAGAVVTQDVPAFSVVGGVPAKIIKSRILL